jgi:predicted transcriptional regulator
MLEKIAEILTKAKIPTLKHPLMHACSLSHLTFDKYIMQTLLPSGLLDIYPAVNLRIPGRNNHHRLIYQTSQKGMEFLKRYNALMIDLKIPDGQRLNFHCSKTSKEESK